MHKRFAFRRFASNQAGMAAVEFALLAPIMVGLLLGSAACFGVVATAPPLYVALAVLLILGPQAASPSGRSRTNERVNQRCIIEGLSRRLASGRGMVNR